MELKCMLDQKEGQKMHLMPCHVSFNTFWYTIQGVHIICKTFPQTKCMQHKRGLLNLCTLVSWETH
jgi:hypothetical protein